MQWSERKKGVVWYLKYMWSDFIYLRPYTGGDDVPQTFQVLPVGVQNVYTSLT